MTAADAHKALEDAARTVPGVRVHPLSAAISPPGVVVGPPRLTWDAVCLGEPTHARFGVFVIVAADDRAVSRLLDFAPAVQAAVEEQTPATVAEANPTTWDVGGQALPAYELAAEYPI